MSPPTRVVWIEIVDEPLTVSVIVLSPPTRVVWIEISFYRLGGSIVQSPPTRVVWIEIVRYPLLIVFL